VTSSRRRALRASARVRTAGLNGGSHGDRSKSLAAVHAHPGRRRHAPARVRVDPRDGRSPALPLYAWTDIRQACWRSRQRALRLRPRAPAGEIPDPVTDGQRYPGGSERTQRLFEGLENRCRQVTPLSAMLDPVCAAVREDGMHALDPRATRLAPPLVDPRATARALGGRRLRSIGCPARALPLTCARATFGGSISRSPDGTYRRRVSVPAPIRTRTPRRQRRASVACRAKVATAGPALTGAACAVGLARNHAPRSDHATLPLTSGARFNVRPDTKNERRRVAGCAGEMGGDSARGGVE
jgi:hypothetical protein